jgi:hypothetical protein
LVLIVLGAIAVDSAVAYDARQQLHDALVGAANDAVAAAVDPRRFYRAGVVADDPSEVAAAVCRAVEAEDLPTLRDLRLSVAVSGSSVEVDGSAKVSPVFARALGRVTARSVRSSATARLAAGPGPAGAPTSPSTTPAVSLPCE